MQPATMIVNILNRIRPSRKVPGDYTTKYNDMIKSALGPILLGRARTLASQVPGGCPEKALS